VGRRNRKTASRTSVFAFQLAEYINPILPTSGVTMGVLGLAKLRWDKWARTLLLYFQAVTGRELVPGVIAVIQTFGDRINLHPLCGAPHNGCHVKRCVM
jgi:uncharacterized ion transporter superfamily protein YfcC